MIHFKSPRQYHSSLGNAEVPFGIVGGGIAALSLALSLQRNQIRSVIFERDGAFADRQQGYGLTIQQGARTLSTLGLVDKISENSQSSRGHLVFDNAGYISLYWKPVERKGVREEAWKSGRNCHITRQTLRHILMDCLDEHVTIVWNSKLETFHHFEEEKIVRLKFSGYDEFISVRALAGCDGIYSATRLSIPSLKLIEPPLRYLGVFVMLGIVKTNPEFPLLCDRVLQMSNGHARIFTMPFERDTCMWQLSFPLEHSEATQLSQLKDGSKLRDMALYQCSSFADPFPLLLKATDVGLITGYPVYDRDPLDTPLEPSNLPVTLLGDAAHPMSPFKGQGANQALLDSISLSSYLSKHNDIPSAFRAYETEMLKRTRSKVLGSRELVMTLHCPELINSEYQLKQRGFLNAEQTLEQLESLRAEGVRSDNLTSSKLEIIYQNCP